MMLCEFTKLCFIFHFQFFNHKTMVCVQVLNVLTDDLGYHKVSIFSPYWMTNKTGRDIEYLVSLKREEEEGGRRERRT